MIKGVRAPKSKEEDHALAKLGIQFLNLPARPLWPPMKYRSSPGLSFVNLQRVGTNLLVSTRNLLAWYEANNGANPVWADTARGGHGDHSISRMGEFRPIVEGNRIYTRWSYRADPLKLVAMNLETREIIWSQNLADSPKAKRIISLGNPVLSGGQIYFASAWDERRPTGRFQLQLSCVDAATGQVIWREDLSISANQLFFEGVFGESLTVHDGAIYCSPSTGFIGRFDTRDGKMEWMYNYESVSRHALAADTKGNAPLIVGDLVISLPRDSNVMVGLDSRTGKLSWRSSLPLAVEIIGQVGQEILIQGRTALASINARNGKIKWHSPYPDKMVGKATLQGASIYMGSQTTVYRYDATTGIERETRSLPETTNSIQNVRVLHDKIYLITDEPVAEEENSLVRYSPGGSAWEVTAWDPKLYFPNGNESSGSEMLIHENDMLHCLEASPAGKVLWQRFVYPRPHQIFFVEGKAILLYNKSRYDLYLKALDQKTGNLEWELTLLRLRAGHGATVGRSGKFLYGKDNSDRFYLVDLNIGKVVLQNRIPRRNGNVKAGFGGGKVHFLMTPAYQRSLYWLQWDIGSNEITGMNQVMQGRNGDPK
ncbi:MAG: PQQ-binding-like beta-propeller repeat protein, partial [Opitutales bacterium]